METQHVGVPGCQGAKNKNMLGVQIILKPPYSSTAKGGRGEVGLSGGMKTGVCRGAVRICGAFSQSCHNLCKEQGRATLTTLRPGDFNSPEFWELKSTCCKVVTVAHPWIRD